MNPESKEQILEANISDKVLVNVGRAQHYNSEKKSYEVEKVFFGGNGDSAYLAASEWPEKDLVDLGK